MNEIKENNKIGIVLLVIMGLALGLYLVWHGADRSLGAAPGGFAAVWATTSTRVAGASNVVSIFATTTGCVSRVISTQAGDIFLAFASPATGTLSTTVGHIQATGTSVAYDSAIYGCGAMGVIGRGASSTITVTEYAEFR